MEKANDEAKPPLKANVNKQGSVTFAKSRQRCK